MYFQRFLFCKIFKIIMTLKCFFVFVFFVYIHVFQELFKTKLKSRVQFKFNILLRYGLCYLFSLQPEIDTHAHRRSIDKHYWRDVRGMGLNILKGTSTLLRIQHGSLTGPPSSQAMSLWTELLPPHSPLTTYRITAVVGKFELVTTPHSGLTKS